MSLSPPAAAPVGRVNFFRSTVFQIIIVGLISFVGPGLWVSWAYITTHRCLELY